MTSDTRQTPPGETGMILIIVLWTVAILTVIAVALTTYVQRNLITVAAGDLQLRSEMVLRSGVSVAAALVLSVKDDDRLFRDHFEREVDIGEGRVLNISVTDASAGIDLNKTEQAFMEAVFIAVLESKGAGKEMAEAVMSIRKLADPGDGKKQAGDAAKDVQSVGEASQQRPKPSLANAAGLAGTAEKEKTPDKLPVFVSPLQLLSLPGIEPEQVNRLIPFAGVASKDGKINPMTAPEATLQAIPKIKEDDLDVIRQARVRKDVKSDAFKKVLEAYKAFISIDPPRVYRVSVEIRRGSGVIAGSRQFATILLTPDAPKPFQVLSLSW